MKIWRGFGHALLLNAVFLLVPNLLMSMEWVVQNSGVSTDLNAVHFIDESTGWTVGNSGVILKTTDGGTNWTSQTSGTTTALQDVQFLNASTGIAVGNDGVVLRTSDGGSTWSGADSGVTDILFSVFWADETNVWTVGQLGRIRTSADSGQSWANGDPSGDAPNQNLRGVFFINTSTGWAVGNSGTILGTEDGGANWSSLASGTTEGLRSVFYVSVTTGWAAGGSGTFLRTSDSGTTWDSLLSTTTNFNSFHFISTDTGRVVGDGGIVAVTSNSGVSFVAERSTTTEDIFDIAFPAILTSFAVGASGTIIKIELLSISTDTATASVPQGSLKPINNLIDPSKGEVTTIQYEFLKSGQVTIRIYNMQGRLVKTLLDDQKPAGTFSDLTWDGRNGNGEMVGSGIYIVHIEAPNFSQNQKIAVVR